MHRLYSFHFQGLFKIIHQVLHQSKKHVAKILVSYHWLTNVNITRYWLPGQLKERCMFIFKLMMLGIIHVNACHSEDVLVLILYFMSLLSPISSLQPPLQLSHVPRVTFRSFRKRRNQAFDMTKSFNRLYCDNIWSLASLAPLLDPPSRCIGCLDFTWFAASLPGGSGAAGDRGGRLSGPVGRPQEGTGA